jgi:hypothetical protein
MVEGEVRGLNWFTVSLLSFFYLLPRYSDGTPTIETAAG